MKIIKPIAAEAIAAINADEAAMSFTFPAMSLYSGETKSVMYSMAVFSSSAIQKRRWVASAKNRGHKNSSHVETGEFNFLVS